METETQSRASSAPSATRDPGPGEGARASLAELRALLLGSEPKRLESIEKRLDEMEVGPEDVSRVLPEAITLRGGDGRLAQSLGRVTPEALRVAVKDDPGPITEALVPVIGPAIRGAISAAFERLFGSFSQAVERSLSPQALRRRLEAVRTGKPREESTPAEASGPRVEHVFLIHGESGLVLQHAAPRSPGLEDATILSGMLAAIQDFLKSPSGFERTGSSRTIQADGFTAWLEIGPRASLAAVVRGKPPAELRPSLQNALERIHAEKGQALREFSGDITPFETCRARLEELIEDGRRPVAKPARLGAAVLAGAALVVVAWGFLSWRSSARWSSFFEELQSVPGIEVTEVVRSSGKYRVRGLKDPFAPDPLALLASRDLSSDELDARWEPYCSLAPEIVQARARALLRPPAGVDVHFAGGALSISGRAPHEWVAKAVAIGSMIPGINELRTEDLASLGGDAELLGKARSILRPPPTVDLAARDGMVRASGSAPHAWIAAAEQLVSVVPGARGLARQDLVDLDERRLGDLKEGLERLRFTFQGGTAELSPESRELLIPAVLRIDNLVRTAQGLEHKVKISVVASKAPQSPESAPRGLEKLRADGLARILAAGGIDAALLTSGAEEATQPSAAVEERAEAQASIRVSLGG